MLHPLLIHIDAVQRLDELLHESRTRPVLVFKHSRTCGVSAEALDELIGHLETCAGHARYGIVTVQTHREVSNAVASRLGVRHETPQAILVRNGRAVWAASHFRVNGAALREAIGSC